MPRPLWLHVRNSSFPCLMFREQCEGKKYLSPVRIMYANNYVVFVVLTVSSELACLCVMLQNINTLFNSVLTLLLLYPDIKCKHLQVNSGY